MGSKNAKYLEKKILENTDRLIECAISASLLSNEAKDKELQRGAELTVEITNYLKDLIEVKDEHLPEILNQIVSQKLPDTKVQETLGTFNHELERILQMGTTMQMQNPLPDFEPESNIDPPVSGEVDDNEMIQGQPDEQNAAVNESQPAVWVEDTIDSTLVKGEDLGETAEAGVEVNADTDQEAQADEQEIADIRVEADTEVEVEVEVEVLDVSVEGDLPISADSCDEEQINIEAALPHFEVVRDVAEVREIAEQVEQHGEANEVTITGDSIRVQAIDEQDDSEISELVEQQVEQGAWEQVNPQDGVLLSDLLTHPEDFAQIKEAQEVNQQNLASEAETAKQQEEEPEQEAVAAFAAMDRADSSPSVKQARGLDFSLRLIYPGSEVLQNVNLDGVSFSFYLPGKQIAIDQEVAEDECEMKEKFCRQEGIAYYVIDPESGVNPRRVERILNSRRSRSH